MKLLLAWDGYLYIGLQILLPKVHIWNSFIANCCWSPRLQKSRNPFLLEVVWTQFNTTQHNTTQLNTTQHNSTQHNTTPHTETEQNHHVADFVNFNCIFFLFFYMTICMIFCAFMSVLPSVFVLAQMGTCGLCSLCSWSSIWRHW